MSSSYTEAMKRLSISGDLASDTFYRVVANLAVSSAMEPEQIHIRAVKMEQNNAAPHHQRDRRTSDKSMSPIIDLGKFFPIDPKIRKEPATSSVKPSSDVEQDGTLSGISNKGPDAHEMDTVLDASGYASTGIGSNALFSDAESLTSSHKKGYHISHRQSGKMLSRTDQTMRMMAYHMGQISFACECHFQDLPLSEMSRADKRHCRRFHKGLIGRKKAGERRNNDV